MAATGRPAPYEGVWTSRARDLDEWLRQHKVVVSATSAALISTLAGYPLESLKSRLQSSRENIALLRLARSVLREEGIGGLWRGIPLPLLTISIVRAVSFSVFTSTKRILNATPGTGMLPEEASSVPPPWVNLQLGLFNGDSAKDVALTSLLAGAASGAVVCVGSAPFELVKVRRQLELQIYRDSQPAAAAQTSPYSPQHQSVPRHPSQMAARWSARSPKGYKPFVAPTTLQSIRMIINRSGILGLYTGWRLHFVRDTMGTALYFAEYDVLRYYLGRKISTGDTDGRVDDGQVQGDVPEWARAWLPKGMIPFFCGSLAGVTSWAFIYPIDAIKTKAQQRALSGLERRTPLTQLIRLVRGPDPNNPKPLLKGLARLYRGLGISMVRSMLTHGMLWTVVDWAGGWIETKPFERAAMTLEAR